MPNTHTYTYNTSLLRNLLFLRPIRSKAFRLIAVTLLLFINSGSIQAASEGIRPITVLSSITPIQLIATAIVGELGHSQVLLPPSANPHNYQLKPSQMRLLTNADLFIWVGPELELFLVKVLKNSAVSQLSLIQNLSLEPDDDHSSEDGQDPEVDHHEHHDHSAHNDDDFDPHIWLNPLIATNIAESIYRQLAEQQPELEPQLKQNLVHFKTQLNTEVAQLTKQFENETFLDIYTFHQAFGHFAEYFNFKISGAITRTPETRPGAKHLSTLANELKEKKKICLIKEPNFKALYIDNLAKNVDVTVVTADPLATEIKNSETGYIEFILDIANSFSQCKK